MTSNKEALIEDARRELDEAIAKLVDGWGGLDHFAKPLSYLIGALYSLRMAQRLGIPDRTSTRSVHDSTDLIDLAAELARGELRTEGRWLQGYWVNNAAVRTAASFERICLAVGYTRSKSSHDIAREEDARQWFRCERDKHLKGPPGNRASEIGTVWDAVNTTKHEFCAPKHRFVAAVNELVLVRALTLVFLLASDHAAEISQAYEAIPGFRSSGRRYKKLSD